MAQRAKTALDKGATLALHSHPMNQLIKDMALEQGIPPYQLRKWKLRGSVPHRYRLPMLLKARKRGEKLSEGDFDFGIPAKPSKRRKVAA